MAKKLGKFLLFTAAVGTAAAAAYYYMQKKDAAMEVSDVNDDDYDDFSDDLDDTESTRTYVPLNLDPASAEDDSLDDDTDCEAFEGDFTPLAEQLSKQADETVDETVEEFFDEDDASEEEPSIVDN